MSGLGLSPYVPAGEHPDGRKLAEGVVSRHRAGLQAKRNRDLLAEMYQLHVDGENDGQYATIVDNTAVMIEPKGTGTYRAQRNILRPVVDNMVSYFAGNRFRVVADVPMGRKARDKARVSTVLGNHIIETQRLNAVLSAAKYIAAVYGSCPVHADWRLDFTKEAYRPIGAPPGSPGIQPGYADIYVGDPWDTVYDSAATAQDLHRASFGRLLPLEQLRLAFGHVSGIERVTGRTDAPSTSRFQRILRAWENLNQYGKGSSTLTKSHVDGDEVVYLLREETAPGVNREFPQGRMTIVAVSDVVDLSGRVGHNSASSVLLLHDGPLPAGRFSFERFFSLARSDDPYGKPYVADLSPLQQELNQVVTLRNLRIAKYSDPQLIAMEGSLQEDPVLGDPEEVLWTTTDKFPSYLSPPTGEPGYDMAIREIETQFFRIAGWQAASRGESNAGDAAAKVVALARADDTVFAPMRARFEESFIRLLQLAVSLYRNFSDLPVLAQVAGDEYGYLVEPWIRKDDLPNEDPVFRITSAFGATPEVLAQTLTNLVVMKGADGAPLLTTEEFWDRHPDPTLKPTRANPAATRRQRLVQVNKEIEFYCTKAEEQYRAEVQHNPQMLFELARAVEAEVFGTLPLLRTEKPEMAIEALDELVHDTTSSALVRMTAELRQARYFDWLQQIMATQGAGAPAGPAGTPGHQPGGSGTPPQTSPFGGTRSSEAAAPENLAGEVRELTSAAYAGDVQ